MNKRNLPKMYKIFMGQAVGSMEVTDMDKEKALEIILANACCTLENCCHLCPYYADPVSYTHLLVHVDRNGFMDGLVFLREISIIFIIRIKEL